MVGIVSDYGIAGTVSPSILQNSPYIHAGFAAIGMMDQGVVRLRRQ